MKIANANWWTAGLAAGLCVILIALIAALSAKPSNDTILQRPSTFFTDPSGAKAIYLVLQRLLPSVEQWRLPLTELTEPARRKAGASFIAMGPEPLGQAEARALDNWISSGGQLILAIKGDWAVQGSPKDVRKTFLLQHGISAVSRSGSAASTAVTKNIGKGRIIYVPDSHAFSNSNLARTDNAVWLAERCEEWGGGVLFDEYHLGFVQQRGLVALVALFVATPWGLACVQLSLAGLVYIFGCRRRFGRPKEELPIERTNPIETVQALGGLFKSAGARALAARAMQQHLNAHVSSIVGRRIDLMDDETRSRLAGPLRIERAELDSYAQAARAAVSGQPLSDADLVQLGQKTTAIARSFSHGTDRGRRSSAAS
jgi:hypothetical protein